MIHYTARLGYIPDIGGENLVEAPRRKKRKEEAASNDYQGEAKSQAGKEREA
jgi:hypothetical protein